jgi:hypothetical protein
MSLWSIEAFVLIPAGAICLSLLLSNVEFLQKISLTCCSVPIAFGRISVSISSLVAITTTCIFLVQSYTTLAVSRHVPSPNQTVEMVDRIRMKEWRNDRNWWISLFACTLWLICWRLQSWVKLSGQKSAKTDTEKKRD